MSVCCFVADVHLGLDYKDPKLREKKFVSLLENLSSSVTDLFLLGDIFDFWYEYKNVIPNKFTRTLGALARLSDRGVKIHYFNGNHDIWTYSYFQNEIGAEVIAEPKVLRIDGKNFFLAHGDDLWEKDSGYKLLKSVFTNRFLQVMFSAMHPRWAFLFGDNWSKHNRLTHQMSESEYSRLRDDVKSSALGWAEEFQRGRIGEDAIDYFIVGHHHIPIAEKVPGGGEFFMLSDWIHHPDYLIFDGKEISYFENIEL